METIEKRYQVFVSSTYRDLVEERQETIQALLEMDCIPSGMELFPAADSDQWELIKNVIDDCDYYIVIVGGRYGSTVAGVSYTEMEFDYAVKQGKPVLGFVHDDPGAIPARDVEQNEEGKAKLVGFIEKVKGRPIRTFKDSASLGSAVSRSLMKLIRQQPGEGWVKGRHATSAEKENELSGLRARVAELELELVNTRNEVTQGEAQIASRRDGFAQGDEPTTVVFTASDQSVTPPEVEEYEMPFSWRELLRVLGPSLWTNATDDTLMTKLASYIRATKLRGDARRFKVDLRSYERILLQFRALGYIEAGNQVSERGRFVRSWVFTALGDDEMIKAEAVRSGEGRQASE